MLETDSPLLLTKRYGATVFDRFQNTMRLLQKFWLETLSRKDDNDDISLVKKFIHYISQAFLVGNSWYSIFKEENYAGTIKTIENFASPDIYQLSGAINNNYKTCLALSEMQEMLAFFPEPFTLFPINPFGIVEYNSVISALNPTLCNNHP